MKTLFVSVFALFVANCAIGNETFFSSPERLKVVVYPGNNGFSIFHVYTADNEDRLGYDYVGIATTGKNSRNRWRTRLLIEIGDRDKTELNFIMTIHDRAVKKEDTFFLQLDYSFFSRPKKVLPLSIIHKTKGLFVFRTNESNKSLIINLKNNTVQFSWLPLQEFHLRWKKDGFDIYSGNRKVATWLWSSRAKIGFRGCDGGVTAIYEECSSFFPLFRKKELFYLQK